MFALAAELAASRPSVAVLANGGEVTRGEVLANLEQRREVVVLAGSGRYADHLAQAARGEVNAIDEATRAAIPSGRVTVLRLANGPTVLTNLIRSRLGRTP
jgi:D-aminopeptidase